MTLAGWLLMLISCGCVLILTTFCYYKVLTTPREAEHLHGPLDIDTRDVDT
ncbi:MAG: hypothetical protein GXY55_19665 [Phycisphaerae bacterium]|nr:hypothetical protein [Phycisphaerae bacterium]